MILSVSHSPKSICTKFTSCENNFNQPVVCYSLTVVCGNRLPTIC